MPPLAAMPPRFCAEFFGTFALVFAGCGAIVINQMTGGQVTHVGVGLTFGLVVMAMIYAVGDVSGAHLNPAVTVAFAAAKRFSWRDVPVYVVAQCGGAIVAAWTLRMMFRDEVEVVRRSETLVMLGQTRPRSDGAGESAVMQSFVLEFILTAILMTVILRVSSGAKEKGITAAIAVGGVVAMEAIFAGPISGASMNPARSLGPALVAGQFSQLWIYLIAPTLGALAAVVVCVLIEPQREQQRV
jgi:aquaporin NIP